MTGVGFSFDRVYVLRFEDPAFAGLEVRCAPITMGELFEVSEIPAGLTLAQMIEGTDKVLVHFFGSLRSWNLVDATGQPVEQTVAALKASQPRELVEALLRAWLKAMAGLDIPLGPSPPSSDGGQYPEASMPMETLSPSL